MKKLKAAWKRLPRKNRALIHCAGIAILSLMIYFCLGWPPLTAQQQFRRLEKAALIGPQQILTVEKIDLPRADRAILARDDHGVAVCTYTQKNIQDTMRLIYRETDADLLLLPFPHSFDIWSDIDDFQLPIVLFDKFEQAVGAEMDFVLDLVVNDVPFVKHYHLNAQREDPGYFLFTIPFTGDTRTDEEAQALEALSYLTGYGMKGAFSKKGVQAAVRLYDEEGNLITEQLLLMESEAMAWQKKPNKSGRSVTAPTNSIEDVCRGDQ